MKDDDSNDLSTVKTRWKDQLKLLREVRKEAFDYLVLHLESLLEKDKAQPNLRMATQLTRKPMPLGRIR